jgi:hypothetical protein
LAYPVTAPIQGKRTSDTWGAGGGWNDNTLAVYPDWYQVTLPIAQAIREINVITVPDTYTATQPTLTDVFTEEGITNFQVQYSTDGFTWTDIPNGNVAGNNKVWRQFTLTLTITARYWRVLINASLASYSRLVAFELWTAGAPVVGFAPPVLSASVSGTNVLLSASSSDTSITRMEFYRDGVLINTDTTASSGVWSYPDQNVAVGTHTWISKAYAPSGIQDSNAVTLTISTPSAGESPDGTVGETVTDEFGDVWTLGTFDYPNPGNRQTLRNGIWVNTRARDEGFFNPDAGSIGVAPYAPGYVYKNHRVTGGNTHSPINGTLYWWEYVPNAGWQTRCGDPRFAQFNVINQRTGKSYCFLPEATLDMAQGDTLRMLPGVRDSFDVALIDHSCTIQSSVGTTSPWEINTGNQAPYNQQGALTIDSTRRGATYSVANPMVVTLHYPVLHGLVGNPAVAPKGIFLISSVACPCRLTVNGGLFEGYFDGILTAAGADTNTLITFNGTEFKKNGDFTGQTHNIYLSHGGLLTLTEVYSHGTNIGHCCKTKFHAVNETGCSFFSGVDGTDSFARDWAEGGDVAAVNCVYVKGPLSDAPTTMTRYGQEAYGPNGGVETDHTGFTDRITWNGCWFVNQTATPPDNNVSRGDYGFISLRRDILRADNMALPIGTVINNNTGAVWTQAMQDRVAATPVNMGPISMINCNLVGVGAQTTYDHFATICPATGGTFSGNTVLALADVEQYTKPNGYPSYRLKTAVPGAINPAWRSGMPLRQFSPIPNSAPQNSVAGMGPCWSTSCFGNTSTTPYDELHHIMYSAMVGGHQGGPFGDQNGVYAFDFTQAAPQWTEVIRATNHQPTNDYNIANQPFFLEDGRPTGAHCYYLTHVVELADGPTIINCRNSGCTWYAGERNPATQFPDGLPSMNACHIGRVGISEPWDKTSASTTGWPLIPVSGQQIQVSMAKDPRTQFVWYLDYDGKLGFINPFTKTWTVPWSSPFGTIYGGGGIDASRDFFINTEYWSQPGVLPRVKLSDGGLSLLAVTGPAAAYLPAAGGGRNGNCFTHDTLRDLYMVFLLSHFVGGFPVYKMFEIDPVTGASTLVCDTPAVADEMWNNAVYDVALRGVVLQTSFFHVPMYFCPLSA